MQGLTDSPAKSTVLPKAAIVIGSQTLETATSVESSAVIVCFPVSEPICLVYTDPDGNVSRIYKIGDTLLIIIPVQYAKGTTEAQKQQYQKAAESYWSGTFDDQNVKLKVIETSTGERNSIKFSDKTGTSYVSSGKNMTLYRENTTEQKEWVEGHETGHLMGLDDKYIEGKNPDGSRKTTPQSGWEKNIMAEFWGKTEKKNIDSILDENKVTTIETGEKHRNDDLH
jgi:hypothetical protein